MAVRELLTGGEGSRMMGCGPSREASKLSRLLTHRGAREYQAISYATPDQSYRR